MFAETGPENARSTLILFFPKSIAAGEARTNTNFGVANWRDHAPADGALTTSPRTVCTDSSVTVYCVAYWKPFRGVNVSVLGLVHSM